MSKVSIRNDEIEINDSRCAFIMASTEVKDFVITARILDGHRKITSWFTPSQARRIGEWLISEANEMEGK